MWRSLAFYFSCFITFFRPHSDVYIEVMVLRKQLEISKRKSPVKRFNFTLHDKLFFVFLNLAFGIQNHLVILSPATLLHWQRRLIASFRTFISNDSHPGRPPVPNDIKELILEMKNSNFFWGVKRIRDELLKLNIVLHKKTIQNILNNFRKRGKVKKTFTWKQFLTAHAQSLFAMDFLTVDTITNKRFYVWFCIEHKTRRIVQYAITEFPTREFVKQQIISLKEAVPLPLILIHDRAQQFFLDYTSYEIQNKAISAYAPNMNAIAERFVKSLRNEALDNFILFNQKQISKIIFQYIEYYNSCRPHQGVHHIPGREPPDLSKCSHILKGSVSRKTKLRGLHSHYYYKETAA